MVRRVLGRAVQATLFDFERGRFALSRWKNLSIVVYATGADGAMLARISKLTPLMRKEFPGGHSNLAFILNGCPLPTEQAQQAIVAAYRNPESGLCCASVIVEGEGFWASALRSSVIGMRLQAERIRLGLHGTISEMIEWLPVEHEKSTGVALNKTQLRRIVTETRHRSLEVLGDRGSR
jgi:hypothetical protein